MLGVSPQVQPHMSRVNREWDAMIRKDHCELPVDWSLGRLVCSQQIWHNRCL